MLSWARRRRDVALPVTRPVEALRVVVFDTALKSRAISQESSHLGRPNLGLVFSAEEVADTGLVKDRREGFSDDFGHREHFQLRKHFV